MAAHMTRVSNHQWVDDYDTWNTHRFRKIAIRCIYGQDKWNNFLSQVDENFLGMTWYRLRREYNAIFTEINADGVEFLCETEQGFEKINNILKQGCTFFLIHLFDFVPFLTLCYISIELRQCKFVIDEGSQMNSARNCSSKLPKQPLKRQPSVESVNSSISDKTSDTGYESTSDDSTNEKEDLLEIKKDICTVKRCVSEILKLLHAVISNKKKFKTFSQQSSFKKKRHNWRRHGYQNVLSSVNETDKDKDSHMTTDIVADVNWTSSKTDSDNISDDEKSHHCFTPIAPVTDGVKEEEEDDILERAIADFEQRGELTEADIEEALRERQLTENALGNSYPEQQNKTDIDIVTTQNELQLEQLQRDGQLADNFMTKEEQPNETSDMSLQQICTSSDAMRTCPKAEVNVKNEIDEDECYFSLETRDSNYSDETTSHFNDILFYSDTYQGQPQMEDGDRNVQIHTLSSQTPPVDDDVDIETDSSKIEMSTESSIRFLEEVSDTYQGQPQMEDGDRNVQIHTIGSQTPPVDDDVDIETDNSIIEMSTESSIRFLEEVPDTYQGQPQMEDGDRNVQIHTISSQTPPVDDDVDIETDSSIIEMSTCIRFLEEANLSKTSVLKKIVSNALRGIQSSKDPQSGGLDTIFLWDISGSVCDKTFMQSKTIIIDHVRYAEEIATHCRIEENIGIVLFGRTTEILCHLTNDYTKLLDKIESVESSGGTTPLTLGLLLCHIEIHKRGGPTSISGYYIPPRIVVVSDGRPTEDAGVWDQSLEMSPKDPQVQQRALTFCKELYTHGYQIFCVSFGQAANKQFLDEMAFAGDGKVYQIDDLTNLYKHFIHQSMVGNTIAICKMHAKEAEYVTLLRQQMRRNSSASRDFTMLDETDENIIIQIIEESEELFYDEVIGLPPLGSRIRRGTARQSHDYPLPEQDGTIVSHQSAHKTFKVSWDNTMEITQHNMYSIETQEIEVLENPKILDHNHVIQIGVKVVMKNPESAEALQIGYVFQVTDSGIVRVRWNTSEIPSFIERYALDDFNGEQLSIHPDSLATRRQDST